MTILDFADFEDLSYREDRDGDARPLSAEDVGNIVALIWSSEGELRDRPFPSSRDLASLFQDDGMPERLRDAVVLEPRVDGVVVGGYTRMVNSAQQGALVGRMNPGHVRVVDTLRPLDAGHVLQRYLPDFREEVDWLKARLQEAAQGEAGRR